MTTNSLDTTTLLLERRLQAYREGRLKWNTSDVLKIRASLLAERPVIDHYLTILVNQFEFLSSGFTLGDEDNPGTIPRFLSEFRESLQRELLSQDGTYKDGLALSLDGH